MPRLRPLALALAALALVPASAHALDNGVARTPPMGWNQWNHFGCSVDEQLVLQTADALVHSGMRDAGYRYVNVDDCWMAPTRDSAGALTADPARFPSGMAALGRQLHRRGLRFGLYISAGTRTCAGYPGSFGHIGQDVATLASWGVDYLKVDWCWPAPASRPRTTFGAIRDAIRATRRRIVFSVSDGFDPAWSWGPGTANLWRTGTDLGNNWTAVARAVDAVAPIAGHGGPGAWNDPDMLQVGNGGMTATEDKSHFSLWAMLAAPLIAGNDVRHMSPLARSVLTNREAIAIDQDRGGRPGVRVRAQHGHEVWVRPLADGTRAVLLLNRTRRTADMRVDLRSLRGLEHGRRYRVRNVWTHRTRTIRGPVHARLPAHGVAMFRVRRG